MKRFAIILMLLLMPLSLLAQTDKREVRRGNRSFRHSDYKQAEIDYRKGMVKDSSSFASTYNLANTLYKQRDFDGAGKMLDRLSEQVAESEYSAQYWFNQGDVALKKKDYAAAAKAFKESLLIRPDDLTAKENYIYARKMMEDQQQGQQGDNSNQDQNQDNQDQDNQDQDNQDNQNNDQNQDNQDQNQDQDNQNGDQNQDKKDQQSQPQEQKVSKQQAQQMLQAIQAKEKETQDKVEKKKAEAMKARQKEKNW